MLIPYSELFVNTGAHENTRYFPMPPGYLKVINGKAVFCRDIEVPVAARKKIILCGEFLDAVGVPEIAAVLDALLESKFEVFIYIAGNLTIINKNNLCMLDELIRLDRIDDKINMVNAAERDGIAKDQMYILNETKLMQILQETSEPCITEEFYKKATHASPGTKIEHLFSNNEIVFAGAISERVKNLLQCDYRVLNKNEIKNFNCAWLVSNDDTEMLSVNISDFERSAEEIERQTSIPEAIKQNIRSISAFSCSPQFHGVINSYPELTSLYLCMPSENNIALSECILNIKWENFKKLESLGIDGYKLSLEDINYILNKCPNIKSLKIKNCQIINGETTGSDLFANDLRAFTYLGGQGVIQENQDLADEFVDSMLYSMPKLKFIRIEDEYLKLMHNDNFPKCIYCILKCHNSHFANRSGNRYMQEFLSFLVAGHKQDFYTVNQYFYDGLEDAFSIANASMYTLCFGPWHNIDVEILSYIFLNSPALSNLIIDTGSKDFVKDFIEKLHKIPVEQRAQIRNLYIEDLVTSMQLLAIINLFPGLQNVNFTVRQSDDDLFHILKQKNIGYGMKIQTINPSNNISMGLTPDESTSYNITKKFFATHENIDPRVDYYRENIFSSDFDASRVVDNATQALNLSRFQTEVKLLQNGVADCDIAINHPNFRDKLADNQLFATTELSLTNQWTKLPSIDSSELLQSLSVRKMIDLQQEVEVEVGYSEKENLYYIRAKQPMAATVIINMVVTINKPVESIHQFDYNLSIDNECYKDIAAACSEFCEKKIDISFPITVEELYNKLYEKRAGSCRERHVVFAHKLIEAGWPASNIRVVLSGTHLFCEVYEDGIWHGLDLGGSPAELTVTDPITMSNSSLRMAPAVDPEPKIKHLSKVPLSDWPAKTLMHINTEATNQYALGVLRHYNNIGTEVLFINSPEKLSCHDMQSDLYRFLNNNDSNRILLVNWNNFSAEEIAQANSILDEVRNVDGVKVPKSVKILGLQDPHASTAYLEADFYSRHDLITVADINIKPYIDEVPWFDPISISTSSDVVVIDCFAQPNWQDFVFGVWKINATGPYFEPSQFLMRLQQGNVSEVVIKNPPFKNDEFQLFLKQAIIRGKFDYAGQEYSFKDIAVRYTDHFDWSNVDSIVAWSASADHSAFIVNNTTVHQLFQQYSFDHEGSLSVLPGLIAECAQRGANVLNLQMTHNIKASYWAMILAECKKYKIQLNVVAFPNMELPFTTKVLPELYLMKTESYISSVPYITANYIADNLLLENCRTVTTLDISELQADELIASIDYQQQGSRLTYKLQISDIIARLESGESVIFYGNFNQDMAEYFASMLSSEPHLWINGERRIFAGKLILVVDQQNAINFQFANMRQIDAKVSYDSSKKPVVFSIAGHTASPPSNLDLEMDRLIKLKQVLDHNSIAYISGATGIGKSSFVTNILQNTLGLAVYNDLDAIEEWIKDRSDKDCILFVDEANMIGSNLTIFNGLFREPKQIFYKGKIYTLSERHKVVLAGNPVSYAGERKLPLLLQQHPQIEVKFDPLSINFIYSKILSELPSEIKDTVAYLYRWSLRLNSDEVLITVRELKMIKALIAAGYAPRYAISTVFLQSIPEKKHPDFLDLLSAAWKEYNPKDVTNYDYNTMFKFQLAKKYPNSANAFKVKDYVITTSRKEVLLNINALLDVRKNSMKHGQAIPMAGLLIEGQPGDGKSDLIRAVLESQGYTQLTTKQLSESSFAPGADHYVIISGNLKTKEQIKILLQAYQNGIAVIMDEFSSNTGLERTLNDILMHQYKGLTAVNPGFILFGTQNPISLSGRKKLSNALQRRLLHIDLPPYSKDEMLQILQTKYPKVPNAALGKLLDAHVSRPSVKIGSTAVKKTFRELLAQAKDMDEAQRLSRHSRRPSM
jgi:MoxR-like ATPase